MDSNSHSRVRVPLLGKILAWLLLNLLLLGVAFLFLFQKQFRFDLDSLLAGPAGDRVQAVSQAVLNTLRSSPPEDWNDVLHSFGDAYKVEFAVIGHDGGHIAGGQDVPEPVLERCRERRGPGEGLGRGPPLGKGPRRTWEELNPPMIPQPRFTIKTHEPPRYWIGLRAPPLVPPQQGEPPRPGPWTLLLATDSLYNGGLFLDLKIWLLAGAGAIALTVLIWIPVVRSLTRSISGLTRATNEIANGNFGVRVPADRLDELGQLGRSVNRMADRLDGFVKGQKRFLGDTAHELCSPIARMQIAIEILEQSASQEQGERIQDLREEVDEMSGLINELLSFSKASLAKGEKPLEPLELEPLLKEAVERELGSSALIQGTVRLHVHEPARALARADLLRRAVANLVRNAVRYAGMAGAIEVIGEADGEWVRVVVRDKGPGVSDQELQKIFDPFYRPEQSRSRETGGAGLGLAIVKACAEACGGTVSARTLSPGLEVVIHLKRA